MIPLLSDLKSFPDPQMIRYRSLAYPTYLGVVLYNDYYMPFPDSRMIRGIQRIQPSQVATQSPQPI